MLSNHAATKEGHLTALGSQGWWQVKEQEAAETAATPEGACVPVGWRDAEALQRGGSTTRSLLNV